MVHSCETFHWSGRMKRYRGYLTRVGNSRELCANLSDTDGNSIANRSWRKLANRGGDRAESSRVGGGVASGVTRSSADSIERAKTGSVCYFRSANLRGSFQPDWPVGKQT